MSGKDFGGEQRVRKNLFATIVYFDGMDYALTTFECWQRFLVYSGEGERIDFLQSLRALKTLQKMGKIKNKNGFWMLNTRSNLGAVRLKKQKISINKLKKVRKYAVFFQLIPYVRGVFITGTLGMKTAARKSDWDVLLVIKRRRLWLGRFLATVFLHLIGKRRHGNKINNRFCLNHFLTEDGMSLEEQNEYTAKELSFSLPLTGGEVWQKFIELNGIWQKKYFPNFEKDALAAWILQEKGRASSLVQAVAEFLGEYSGLAARGNVFLKKVMIVKIKRNPNTYLKGADIRYSDRQLVFLPKPQRDKIRALAEKKLTKLFG